MNLIEEIDVHKYLVFKKDGEDGPDVKGGQLDALIVHASKVQKICENGKLNDTLSAYLFVELSFCSLSLLFWESTAREKLIKFNACCAVLGPFIMAPAPTVQISQRYKCFSITHNVSLSISFPFATLSLSLSRTHKHTHVNAIMRTSHILHIFDIFCNHNRTEISISLEQNGTRHSHFN